MDFTHDLTIIAAVIWGLACGLYISFTIIKHVRRRYCAGLRRAKRIAVEIDTQIINRNEAITRITINGTRTLVMIAKSDSPIEFTAVGADGQEIHPRPHTVVAPHTMQ